MSNPSDKAIAQLVASLFQTDHNRIDQIVKTAAEARSRGESVDILDEMVVGKLLSEDQAYQVRNSLDATVIDVNSPVHKSKKLSNGATEDGSSEASALDSFTPTTLGRYRVLRTLGEGGMGKVFLAYDEKENQQVALKVLPANLAHQPRVLDRFYREAKNGNMLNHENIVRNIDAGQDRLTGSHYLVLEYVDGFSALQLLERIECLSVGDAVHIILDIAQGLEHAHSRNIIHRDIKPANILLTKSGIAKLADLGLAKRTDEASHLTAARQGFGTPYYMPYEQAINAKYADVRSDIFALGATLYHFVTGEVPFPGTNHLEIVEKKDNGRYPAANSVNADVPLELDEILCQMLAREPANRYQTVSELIVDLERSGLSALMPSFADEKAALEDPVVRQRRNVANQPTCLDLKHVPKTNGGAKAHEFWYVRLKDRNGRKQTAKMPRNIIVERLRQGRISPKVEASRKPRGKFQALSNYAEFQNIVKSMSLTSPAEETADSPRKKTRTMMPAISWWWIVAGASTIGGIAAIVFALIRLIS